MAPPLLQSLQRPSNVSFDFGEGWEHMTQNHLKWAGFSKELYLSLRAEGEQELTGTDVGTLPYALEQKPELFSKTVTRVPSLSQPPESLRSLDASNQMVQNSRRKCQPYITSYFQSRNRKWNPQHCFPLFLNKHAPCLAICLPQAKEWTCSVCVIARPYLWRSPQWVDTESPPRPPDIYLSETSENAETFSLLTALPGWDVRHWWQSRER